MNRLATALSMDLALLVPSAVVAQGKLAVDNSALRPLVADGGALRGGASLRLKGTKSGDIPAAREAALTCVRISHSVVSPRDVASGLPTGQRQHKPLVCSIRNVSKGVLSLMQALYVNENMKTATFTFGGADTSTLTLTNANIASFDTRSDADGLYFDITFTYQKIEWTKDGTTAADDWRANAL